MNLYEQGIAQQMKDDQLPEPCIQSVERRHPGGLRKPVPRLYAVNSLSEESRANESDCKNGCVYVYGLCVAGRYVAGA